MSNLGEIYKEIIYASKDASKIAKFHCWIKAIFLLGQHENGSRFGL